MGQFKPMVKMMTTEPSVELKLKKGGAVKKAMGGVLKGTMGAAKNFAKSMGPVAQKAIASQVPMDGKAPSAPSMAARRAAMSGAIRNASKFAKNMATKAVPAAMGGYKEGGESKAAHKAEMKAIKGVKSEIKSHESKPASKAHKGLKTGGVAMGNAGGYATGGVVLGNAGGYKTGGIIKSTSGKTKMVTAQKKGKTNYATGGVALGNAGGMMDGGMVGNPMMDDGMMRNRMMGGGYKKGGAPKKFAEGGSVQDDGRPQKMPQGNKPPSKPVSISRLSGSFKKGGGVKKMAGGGSESDYDPIIDREMARKGAEKATERADNEAMRDMILDAPKRILQGAKRMIGMGEGSVSDKEPKSITKTERSVTVTPSKKRGGKVC